MNNDLHISRSPSALFSVRPGLSSEEALANASEILASVISMGYEGAFTMNGTERQKSMGVIQLVEMAQLLVNQALEQECPTSAT